MRNGIGVAAALALLTALFPAPGTAQERGTDPVRPDTLEERFERARAVRDTLTRPPGEPGTSSQDLFRLPFQLVGVVGLVFYESGRWVLDRADDLGLADDVGDLAGVGEDPSPGEQGARPPRGFDVDPGSFSYRSWPAVSVRYDLPPFFAEVGLSARLYQLHRAGAEIGDSVRGAGLVTTWATRREPHFWGIGPETTERTRSDYSWERAEVELRGRLPLGETLRLTGDLTLEQNEVGRGHDDDRPDLHDVFAGSLPFGATGRTRLARAGAALTADWTSVSGFQRKGLWLDGSWAFYEGLAGTDARFQRLGTDVRAYLPVTARQSLALRILGATVVGEDGRGVPFMHLPALGDDDGLRGFRSRRFRDRTLLSLTAEWRYEVYWTPGFPEVRVEGFVFADHGTVAPELGVLDEVPFHTTPGLGLRLVRGPDARASAFVAFGGDQALRVQVEIGAGF